jgi:transcriptional regulator with XRE-family HTH domain
MVTVAARSLEKNPVADELPTGAEVEWNDIDLESNQAILARRVRAARQQEGWTLQELASRCGLAISTIQKIETDQMVPTLSVLSKLANGLRRRVSFLIGEDTAEGIEISYRPARDRRAVQARNQVRVESLAGELRDPAFDAYEFFIPPGQDSGPDPVTHRGDELLVCLEGEIEVTIGDRVFELRIGDSVHYKSIAPHRWRNIGRSEARMILVGSYRSHRVKEASGALHAVDGHIAAAEPARRGTKVSKSRAADRKKPGIRVKERR